MFYNYSHFLNVLFYYDDCNILAVVYEKLAELKVTDDKLFKTFNKAESAF